MDGHKLLLALILAIFASASADVSRRTIDTQLYPDCSLYTSCKERRDHNVSDLTFNFPNLVYVRAMANKDILHYVMTTIDFPSILIVQTTGSSEARLNFNWDHLLLANNETDMAGAINATGGGEIVYSYTLVVSRLIEYNDLNDNANPALVNQTDASLWNITDFSEFSWMNVTMGQGGKSVIFNTSYPQPVPYGNNTAGSLSFEFELNGDDGRDSDLPRLIYNANNTQFNFALDGYVPNFNSSRYALEMSVVAQQSPKAMQVEETKSIDDEYSPGVFRVVNWYTRGEGDDTGYIQWKPVCYLDSQRARDVGTEVSYSDLQEPNKVGGLEGMIERSLARAFYGNKLNNTKQVSQMSSNVSFGLSQDGFYLKNNYTVWTASVGYGTAPVETISTMVLIIIAAGLGIPVIIIIFGGIYVCIRKRRRGSGYQRIDNDGLTNSYPNLNS